MSDETTTLKATPIKFEDAEKEEPRTDEKPAKTAAPTLSSLREQTRRLYIDLARFRVSSEVLESEVGGTGEAMDDAEKTLRALDKMVKARHAKAEQGSETR